MSEAAWRTVDDQWALKNIGEPMAVRSREVPERRLLAPLEEEGIGTPEVRKAVSDAFAVQLYGKNAAKDLRSRQALLLGEPEIDFLLGEARMIAKAAKDAKAVEAGVVELFKTQRANLSALRKRGVMEAGLEAALFGRMVTSDPEANTDAAIHVAHAFTVHKEETESDYFTVVDDLTHAAGETGTAGLFDTELTAGLFYGYVVIDVPLLVANVGADPALAGKVQSTSSTSSPPCRPAPRRARPRHMLGLTSLSLRPVIGSHARWPMHFVRQSLRVSRRQRRSSSSTSARSMPPTVLPAPRGDIRQSRLPTFLARPRCRSTPWQNGRQHAAGMAGDGEVGGMTPCRSISSFGSKRHLWRSVTL